MEEYEEIDLAEIFDMIWNKKFVIILIIAIFAIMGFVYTKTMTKPEYKATTKLVLVSNNSSNTEGTITQAEVTLNQKLVATYTEIIKTKSVLRQVIENTGLNIDENELRENVSVKLVTSTQLIEISVTDSNPENTVIIANEISKVLIDKAAEIYGMSNISILDNAKLPTVPYNVNYKKNIMIFSIMGIIVAFGYVFISSMFDSTIKNVEQAEKRLKLTVLASIPQYNYNDAEKLNKKKKGKNAKKVVNEKSTEKSNKKKGEK